MNNSPMNPAQRSAVAITLRRLEHNLRAAREWLEGRVEEGILYRKALELPTDRRQTALERIEQALVELRALAEALDLPPVEENAARGIMGEMHVLWADLMDTHAPELRRYGPVEPELSRVLDAPVTRLAEISADLGAIFTVGPAAAEGGHGWQEEEGE